MRNIPTAEESAVRLREVLLTLGRMRPLRDPVAQFVEPMGLTPAQVHALLWLGREGRLSMGELARRLGVTVKTVTGVVDRLENQGLAARDRNTEDRRVVDVALTDDGLRIWSNIDAQILGRATGMLEALGPDDRESLVRIVERVVARLLEMEAPR